ncbi:MAG: hypothetical protein WC994_03140 [Brumimicrobium sp.]
MKNVFAILIFISLSNIIRLQEQLYDETWERLNNTIEYKQSTNYKKLKNKSLEQVYSTPIKTKPIEYKDETYKEKVEQSREKLFKDGEKEGVEKQTKSKNDIDIEDLNIPDSEAPGFNPIPNNIDNFNPNPDAIQLIFYLIGIGLVAFLVYRLIISRSSKGTLTNNENDFAEDVNPETIKKSDLQTELKKAIDEENYRLAIRIYYIQTLKAFVEAGFIKWKKKKTNYHYLLEVSGKKEFFDFQKAIQIYEWTWYGKNEPKPATFERFSKFFNHFLKQIESE